jgi:hypothetical protein
MSGQVACKDVIEVSTSGSLRFDRPIKKFVLSQAINGKDIVAGASKDAEKLLLTQVINIHF